MEIANFPILPRSEATWRLVGYGPTGEGDLLFDYTLTNRVRSEPLELAAQRLPLDLKLQTEGETIEMDIKRAIVLPKAVQVEATFWQNEIPTWQWRIGNLSYSDADGNVLFPSDGCREKTALRISGDVIFDGVEVKEPMRFEFTIDPKQYGSVAQSQ